MQNTKRGRPAIGPKVQTQITEEQAIAIREEAKARGVPEAVVLREVIAEGLRSSSIRFYAVDYAVAS